MTKILASIALFFLAAVPLRADIYAVVVGISDYNDPFNNLRFADDDARHFYAWLVGKDGLQIPAANVTLLLDEKATQSNINQSTKTQFGKATAEDCIIFYFSGHGTNGLFCTYPENMFQGYISHSQIKSAFKQSNAGVKLCFADACHAGSFKPSTSETFVFQNTIQQDWDCQAVVFMASRADEVSIENKTIEQGVFTYYLLKGLKGRADANEDKKIAINELFAYVSKNVIYYTEHYYQHQQHPTMTGNFDENMLLVGF